MPEGYLQRYQNKIGNKPVYTREKCKLLTYREDVCTFITSNPELKRKNYNELKRVLKSIYQPSGNWGQGEKGLEGIINLDWENQSWSILNRLPNNYSALCLIINEINRIICQLRDGGSNIKQINFKYNDKATELDEFHKRLEQFKNHIFVKGTDIFDRIIKKISTKTEFGTIGETKGMQVVMNMFNPKSITKGSEREDALFGIDFIFDGKTVQAKNYKSIELVNMYYVVRGTSGAKKYRTDYYTFYNMKTDETYLFKNDFNAIELTNGDYFIPEKLKIFPY